MARDGAGTPSGDGSSAHACRARDLIEGEAGDGSGVFEQVAGEGRDSWPLNFHRLGTRRDYRRPALQRLLNHVLGRRVASSVA